jgi:hypothetical protein
VILKYPEELIRPGAISIVRMHLGYEPHPVVLWQESNGEVIIRCDSHIYPLKEISVSNPIARLREALGYAKFTNVEVKEATLDLIKTIETDLTVESTYEPSTETETAEKSLAEVMNDADESTSENEGEEDVE